MDKPVHYHPAFECDVHEAARWYNRRSHGLGDAFVEVVRQTVKEITARPQTFARESIGCRIAQLHRFPYVVLFDEIENELFIFGVLHTARSMKKWRERLQDD